MQGRREPVRTGKDNAKGMPIYRLGAQAGAWSGKDDPPKIGDQVDVSFNGLGTGRVSGYAVVHDYLAMRVVFDNPPDWYIAQNGRHYAGHVFGAELRMSKFIIWDRRDNYKPRQDADGTIISDGVLGRLDADNVYLRTYACWPDDRRPADLAVGDCIEGVIYRLSGERGTYDIYRVE